MRNSDGGPATEARLSNPSSVFVDNIGNIFIADLLDNRIRRVDGQTGIITTVAGTGGSGSSGDGGPATEAELNNPSSVFVDGGGNIFIADNRSRKVRRVDAQTGIITTVAGTGMGGIPFSGDGGPATEAQIANPSSVFVDRMGNLFIAESAMESIAEPTILDIGIGPGSTSEITPSDEVIKGDVTGDGVVNLFDLVFVASQFGRPDFDPEADVNDDGVVNLFDLVMVGSNFGVSVAVAPSLAQASGSRLTFPAEIASVRQALAALDAMQNPPDGAIFAREFLRALLLVVDSPVTETKLLANYPNPFNPETWIPYELKEASTVRIKIYSATGKSVRTLNVGFQSEGRYISKENAAYWDGKNESGEQVSSGSYFYHFRAGDYSATRKMIILK